MHKHNTKEPKKSQSSQRLNMNSPKHHQNPRIHQIWVWATHEPATEFETKRAKFVKTLSDYTDRTNNKLKKKVKEKLL